MKTNFKDADGELYSDRLAPVAPILAEVLDSARREIEDLEEELDEARERIERLEREPDLPEYGRLR